MIVPSALKSVCHMSQDTSFAPAIPLEILIPPRTQHYLEQYEPLSATKISGRRDFYAIRSFKSTILWSCARRFPHQSTLSRRIDKNMIVTETFGSVTVQKVTVGRQKFDAV
jgi:hypothetical protein